MPRIRLNALKKFNPALVYTVEPENIYDQPSHYLYMEGYIGQQTDIFEALLYAQNEILPALAGGFESLTAEQFIHWIKTIHKKAAKTVLQASDQDSGVYAKEPILRWENTVFILPPIYVFLSNRIQLSCQGFGELIKKDFPDIDLSTFIPFMNLLIKIRDDESIPQVNINIKPDMEGVRVGVLALAKLHFAFNMDLLTSFEKSLINQYVKICMLPSQYESAMNAYAETSIVKLQNCDRHDLDSVSAVLADIFYGIVGIHPFANGNGRTATVLTNALAYALGQPSILLRYPNERDDKSSSYSMAMSVVDTTRVPLASLIKLRLTSAPYADSLSAQTAEEKSKLLNRAKLLEKNINRKFVEQFFEKITPEFLAIYRNQGLSPTEMQKLYASYTLTALQPILFPNNDSKKSFLQEKLTLILGPDYQWKFFNDKTPAKNPIGYIELKDQATRDKLVTLLKATQAMTVTAMQRADNHIPVIKLQDFNYAALLEIEPEEENLGLEQSISYMP